MPIVKENGRFRARLKQGRQNVASKTFDTRREAKAWLDREQAALAGGLDPRAGKERVAAAVERWLKIREKTVAPTTYRADANMNRLMPPSLANIQLGVVSGREVARTFEVLISDGLEESSVNRYRASLSAFFAWCMREKLIGANPVTGVKVPKGSNEVDEMDPFTHTQLEAVYAIWRTLDPHFADIMYVLGWTGLRWGEIRAMQVANFMEVPTPGLMVRRNQPEGYPVKATKGRAMRRVPLADAVLPIVRKLAEGKRPTDFLFPAPEGGQLWRTHALRALDWKASGQGRRIHDLRHTAACLWLSKGVDPATVQQWCGHESIATTNLYLHFLGTGADRAGLDLLNRDPGAAGGPGDGARDA